MDVRVPVEDGVALHVRYRPGTVAPAFLLLHGIDSNARMWDLVADRLAGEGHAVYAIDQRGHGESDTPDHGYDNPTAAADTAKVAGALGLSGAVIAGHSWGALLSLRLANLHPELVAGLALVDGGWAHAAAVCDSWEQFSGLLSMSDLDLTGAGLDAVRDFQRAVYPDWPEQAIEASLHSLRINPDGSLTPRLTAERRTSILRSVWDDPPAQWFAAIDVPALLMPAVPRQNRRWEIMFQRIRACVEPAAAALSRSTVREYLDADHDLHAQHPDRVAGDLLWLAGEARRLQTAG